MKNKIEQQLGLEKKITPEIPRDNWESLIILQRHGRYDNRVPKDMENIKEEERKYGHLTEKGIEELRKITEERLRAISEVTNLEKIDILLINSPTYWYDIEGLGQRAKETAEIIGNTAEEFAKRYNVKGLKILNHEYKDKFKGEKTRPDKKLGEALFFQNKEFVDFLIEEYGGAFTGQGEFWDDFNLDKHSAKREEFGAEGPDDLAERLFKSVAVATRFANFYHKKHDDRKLVVWMVTHGDGLEPFVQKKFGVGSDDFVAKYNEAVGMGIYKDGKNKMELNGKTYKLNLKNKKLK